MGSRKPSTLKALCTTVLVPVLFGAMSTAQAQQVPDRSNGYVGLSYIEWKSKVGGLPSYSAETLRVRGGVVLNDTFSLEAHALAGGSDKDVTFIEHELKYGAGAFVRAATPAVSDLRFYALAGVSHLEVNHMTPFGDLDRAETSFAYGGGLEVLLMRGLSFKVDAMRYVDKSDFEFDVLGAELGLRF